MEEFLSLETPEQIEIGYRIARLGSRFIAALWDTLALGVLQIMLLVGAVVFTGVLEGVGVTLANWAWAVLVLLSFILLWGYYILFETLWNGQSPGKRLVGIRTVRRDGYPIGIVESAIRNIVRIIDFLPFSYGLGVLVMFVDSESRRLGDLAAGTIVVYERPAQALSTLRRGDGVVNEALLTPPLHNLELLDLQEVEAARRFLSRRDALENAETLSAHLAARLRDKLDLPEEVALTDIELLERVVAQHGR